MLDGPALILVTLIYIGFLFIIGYIFFGLYVIWVEPYLNNIGIPILLNKIISYLFFIIGVLLAKYIFTNYLA